MFIADISPEESSFYSKIVLDYLHGVEQLKPFYQYAHSLDSFDEAIKQKAFSDEDRKILVQRLKDQYSSLGLSPKSKSFLNIESLLLPNAYTVTTGHQLCVLTGPVYFLIKIIHTIKLAEELKLRFPDKHFVPVFWMASEDHDFDEIKSISIDGNAYTWPHVHTKQPVGDYDLAQIQVLLDEVKAIYGSAVPELLQSMESVYKNASNLSEATFKIVHHLFEKYGLVIIEPNHVDLKQSLRDVMREDIIGQTTIGALNETNQAFQKLKYKQQINGRPINFFYLGGHGRVHISRINNRYIIGEGEMNLDESEMLKLIEHEPQRFSPNVVLRPVYQERILPNLAYIGGPGEVAYWLQLKGVFKLHQIQYPVLLLRNSFAILNASLHHKLKSLDLPSSLYFGRYDTLHVNALKRMVPTSEDQIAIQMDGLLQELINQTEPVSNHISTLLIEEKKHQQVFFEQFKKRLRKAIAHQEKQQLEKLFSIRNYLFPENTPAERVNNVLNYVRMNDHQAFIEAVYELSTPITHSIKLMVF